MRSDESSTQTHFLQQTRSLAAAAVKYFVERAEENIVLQIAMCDTLAHTMAKQRQITANFLKDYRRYNEQAKHRKNGHIIRAIIIIKVIKKRKKKNALAFSQCC